ncbi:tRNA 4-thiouridine(8) synthase ThiI [Soehngenia longivitae]|uniref:Probable tRNA sulfurtransferase n=1 Tax=Soehngenia longivitae TaxID=2562294 RepID=A0A4Z0D5N8_9FIRM|nr:tRNA uracil 4-sulfurtransferase ThiI [Soehngenia longivitae]TFZ39993.1 tRNA 4-thiouridine(8) synthase ThiI [Soehngenia longivitae]
MDKVISISLGEIVLKGLNRKYFENKLIDNIKRALKGLGDYKIYKEQGKIYIEGLENAEQTAINRLTKIFGIIYVSPCIRTSTDLEDIKKASITLLNEKIKEEGIITFKVNTTRSDKRYPLISPEVSRIVGGAILDKIDNVKVDVISPKINLYIDIKENAYVYIDKFKSRGGLPIGTNGKGLLLLSGGIDSPVAGYMMAKRGVEIDCLHFHSYPFTSQRAEEKVLKLAEELSIYTGPLKVYSINLLNIQKAINENCPEDQMTILSRRFMMRIGERIAQDIKYDCLITGENLGQVASQTIESINVIEKAVNMTILRPLIGFDKTDIVKMAIDIETYETSILPFEDCCTVFLPKHPLTRPKLKEILKAEESLEIENLIDDALKNKIVRQIK